MKFILIIMMCASIWLLQSCAPAVIGGAAVGGYKVATDERSSGTMLDDSILSTKVKTGLIKDKLVKARHIDVNVVNSVVFLVGVVESDAQKRMASNIARGVKGVSRVENQLAIGQTSAGQKLDDLILGSRIKTALIRHPDVKSLNIDVDVNNNVVTLGGAVRTTEEKNTVLSIVRQTAGSVRIVDNISIGG